MNENEKKPSTLKMYLGSIGYGSGAIGLDLSYGMFYSYLMIFLTDILKLPILFLLLLTPLARIWDGVNDPMMGTIVDNSRFKKGKYKPWVIIGAIANAVVLFFLFTDFGVRGIPLYILITVLYIGWGMTNTMADIPFWSMIPSFTTDPERRSILSTVARAFSGLGQGIILMGAPIFLKRVSPILDPNAVTTEKGYNAAGFSALAACSAVLLVLFAVISMSTVKEKPQPPKAKEKFSFKKVFAVLKENDQVRAFILFAMLSNTGYYIVSGVATYFFVYVIEDIEKQSLFSAFGAVGSILGLLFLPIMMKFTSRRRTYQASLLIVILGYAGMFLSFKLLNSLTVMNICYLIANIGTGSMFVSQTVFLADVVDYGEVKMGYRSESVTFSMKGFLQKLAYTIQVIILLVGLGNNYTLVVNNDPNADIAGVKTALTIMMLVLPAIFFILSLIVFSLRFKLHGEFMESITEKVTALKEEREKILDNSSTNGDAAADE